jgi:hypothetical protein
MIRRPPRSSLSPSSAASYVYKRHGYYLENIKRVVNIDRDARKYMTYLLNKDGPFRHLFPYMHHHKPRQVLKDRGIIFKNLLDKELNAGLLWTFIQATRFMYEHPEHMKRFLYLAKKLRHEKVLALFASIAIQPTTANLDGNWALNVPGHCSPLGSYGISRAKGFLTGKLIKLDSHCTTGSANCFGGTNSNPNGWQDRSTVKPLDTWLNQFRKAANGLAKAA